MNNGQTRPNRRWSYVAKNGSFRWMNALIIANNKRFELFKIIDDCNSGFRPEKSDKTTSIGG